MNIKLNTIPNWGFATPKALQTWKKLNRITVQHVIEKTNLAIVVDSKSYIYKRRISVGIRSSEKDGYSGIV